MFFLETDSLTYWESFAEWGAIAVTIGVIGEGVELLERWRKRRKEESILVKEASWLLTVETLSLILLVGGLAMEIIGTHKASTISRAENAKLVERAEKLSNETEKLRKSNLESQIKLEELRAGKVSAKRIISPAGSNFITAQLKSLPPLNVRLAWSAKNQEAFDLHNQLSAILKNAGCNVQLWNWPPVDGVFVNWKELGTNESEINSKLNMANRIFDEIGEKQSDFRQFMILTNLDVDLQIIVGKHSF